LVSLIEIVQENNDASLQEYCHLLEEKEQVAVSPFTMCNVMQQFDLGRKKTLHASEKHTERIQQMRVDY
jgi:transposase